MKSRIKECARKSGVSDIGFLKAEKGEESDVFFKDIPFVNAEPSERTNPFSVMADAKSVIVMLFSYKTDFSGNISKYAHGKDYHLVLKEKAEPIISLLLKEGFKAEFFCDNAVMDERFLARKAGLGFIGKNGFLISPKLGSFVFIAHIVTDCEILPDAENKDFCKSCGKCIKACPTKALATGDFYSCLSYITQKKGELSDSEKKLISDNKMCWGCDICQECCPHNENAPNTDIPEFSEDLIINLDKLSMSNREFKKMYADRAFSWRGKGVLERNIRLINK